MKSKISRSLTLAAAMVLGAAGQGILCVPAHAEDATPNTLSAQEKTDGWRMLWDGKTTEGWRSPGTDAFPKKGWAIVDGALTVGSSPTNGEAEAHGGGDIITSQRYSNFELQVDFKITPGCNSGIKTFVQAPASPADKAAGKPSRSGPVIGLEYQIIDDNLHPDAKLGRDGNRKLGALYDLMPAGPDKHAKPMDEWNHALIISHGNHVEHWLNGQKVLQYERGSADFRNAVALSKFKNVPNFGEWPDGHILLQEHGSQVSFRNIKIRLLPG